jgi:5-methylcytosine-specific restriction protein A
LKQLTVGAPAVNRDGAAEWAGVPAFLLTWNPERFAWEDLPQMARRVRAGRRVRDSWSCARSKQIRRGARLFMLRQGKEPRGIFASGWATSDWYEGPNWRGPGYCHYLDLVYDMLLDPARDAILPREALRSGKLARMYWDTQASGVGIPDEIAAELERTWASLSPGR